jgi:hypothetical protein
MVNRTVTRISCRAGSMGYMTRGDSDAGPVNCIRLLGLENLQRPLFCLSNAAPTVRSVPTRGGCVPLAYY